MMCPSCLLNHASDQDCSEAVAEYVEKEALRLMDEIGVILITRETPGKWPNPNDFGVRVEANLARVKSLRERADRVTGMAAELRNYKRFAEVLERRLLLNTNSGLTTEARLNRLLSAMPDPE